MPRSPPVEGAAPVPQTEPTALQQQYNLMAEALTAGQVLHVTGPTEASIRNAMGARKVSIQLTTHPDGGWQVRLKPPKTTLVFTPIEEWHE